MKNLRDYYRVAKTMLLVACFGLAITACSDDNDDIVYSDVKVEVQAPTGISNIEYDAMNITFTDTATKETTTFDFSALQANGFQTKLIEGLYDIMIEGDATADLEGVSKAIKVRGDLQAVEITANGELQSLSIPLQLLDVGSGFVFAEIFVSGTLTPEGNSYLGDSYFRLYNNSDEVLDAQGLAILESAMQSNVHHDFFVLDQETDEEDIQAGDGTPYDTYKTNYFITDAIYMIPRGEAVLVQPGESLLLVDVAKDHSVDNANSFNLSVANYEWYDENDRYPDTQTEVPDLDKLYASSKSIWIPHQGGIKAYALAQIPAEITPEQFAEDNIVNYYYEFVYGDLQRMMTSKRYEIPTSWIQDCVNLSNQTDYEWNEISSVLDKSYAWVSDGSQGASNKGKSVRRKVLSGKLLLDTNDSANDFEQSVEANPFYEFHD